MSNSLRSKELALNRKLRIYKICVKKDNLLRNRQIFEFFPWGFPFHLVFLFEFPEFSVDSLSVDSLFGISHFNPEIVQQFPDLLEPFEGNFRTVCPII